jgi:hypothetical protein
LLRLKAAINKRSWVLKTDIQIPEMALKLLSIEKWAVPGLPIIALTAEF